MAYWWSHEPAEKYWLEITDRDDIGKDLEAPEANEHGKPFWSYSLVRDVRRDDVVFHYDKRRRAITAFSVATGETRSGTVIWGARGASARTAQIKPHERPGVYHGLRDLALLPRPVTLEMLRDAAPRLEEIRARLRQSTKKGGLYLPFELSGRRPLRLIQGYLAKFPAGLISLFDGLPGEVGPGEARPAHQYRQTPGYGTGKVRYDVPLPEYRIAVPVEPQLPSPPIYDPDVSGRGAHKHAELQNLLAGIAKDQGRSVHSPDGTPSFDLAWRSGTTLVVVEVKTITPENEERQLRMAVGQVLRYKQLLEERPERVAPVIALECRPRDERWIDLCRSVGIGLIWPEVFSDFISST